MQHHPDSPKPCLPVRVLALRDKDYESLSRSASGGAFAVLARAMLARGGAVFGAELCEDNIVRITCVEDVSELWRLQGSKYVQCLPNGSFLSRAVTFYLAAPPVWSTPSRAIWRARDSEPAAVSWSLLIWSAMASQAPSYSGFTLLGLRASSRPFREAFDTLFAPRIDLGVSTTTTTT